MAETVAFSWQSLLQALNGKRPLIAGIVNATPDSFSDGKGSVDAVERVAFALQLLDEGADILDIGGESTRPGACEVDSLEEWARLSPVINGVLAQRPDAVISVDTRHSDVAAKALRAGALIINDVSGLTFDPAMREVIASGGAGAILTHSTAIPELMQKSTYALDRQAVTRVKEDLHKLTDYAAAGGILSQKLMLDVGIGFGKSRAANYDLLRHAASFEKDFQLPFWWGVSRKSLLAQVPDTLEKRIAGSLALAVKLAEAKVSLLRVHDVAATISAINAAAELGGTL